MSLEAAAARAQQLLPPALQSASFEELTALQLYDSGGLLSKALGDGSGGSAAAGGSGLSVALVAILLFRMAIATVDRAGRASVVRRLEPVLDRLRHLGRRPAQRRNIPDLDYLACYLELREVPGAPDFRIDAYDLVVSGKADRGCPFACELDHLIAVALGGGNEPGNLMAVQWRVNQLKSDQLMHPDLHGPELVARLKRKRPHGCVTLQEFQELAAKLRAQGKEPTYKNVAALLPREAPDSGAPDKGSAVAPLSLAERLASKQTRVGWTLDEQLALVRAAAPMATSRAAARAGGRRECIQWGLVAAAVSAAGNGRTPEQCKDQWASLESPGEQQVTQQAEEEEPTPRKRAQPNSGWGEEEADRVARLLGAYGRRLEGRGFGGVRAQTKRVEALVRMAEEVFLRPLAQAMPGRQTKDVVDKCRGMVETAAKLALDKPMKARKLTAGQWEAFAPHLAPLARELAGKALAAEACSDGGRRRIQEFVNDPPMKGVPGLRPLAEYQQPQQADGGSSGSGVSALGEVVAYATRRQQPASAATAAAPAARKLAAAQQVKHSRSDGSPGSSGDGSGGSGGSSGEVIDLTLSDDE